ncbi:GIN domain-containing protein [Sphingorhabdus arenilitoris]|uniref:GIN domain-containing protein n=1 Tax=Sphingorhabdus arenilitoris TaxID=1490041 RepID=A0ABV8RIK2_9SPHN
MIYRTLSAALLFTAALAQPAHAESRKLLIGGFQDIIVDGDIRVIITTGKGSSGRASGDRRILDLLKLDRVSDTLTVRVQRPPNNDIEQRISEPLVVTLTTQQLRNITLTGNGSIKVSAIDRPGNARLYVNGGGNIQVERMKVDQLQVNIFGTGAITVDSGKARETTLQIDGSPQVDIANFQNRKISLQVNGNAKIAVQAAESATINSEGSSNITVTGTAECLIRRAGNAVIRCPKED